jgi:plasmid maintenance system antidote protein VapI
MAHPKRRLSQLTPSDSRPAAVRRFLTHHGATISELSRFINHNPTTVWHFVNEGRSMTDELKETIWQKVEPLLNADEGADILNSFLGKDEEPFSRTACRAEIHDWCKATNQSVEKLFSSSGADTSLVLAFMDPTRDGELTDEVWDGEWDKLVDTINKEEQKKEDDSEEEWKEEEPRKKKSSSSSTVVSEERSRIVREWFANNRHTTKDSVAKKCKVAPWSISHFCSRNKPVSLRDQEAIWEEMQTLMKEAPPIARRTETSTVYGGPSNENARQVSEWLKTLPLPFTVVASKLGVDPKSLRAYCNGDRPVTVPVAERIWQGMKDLVEDEPAPLPPKKQKLEVATPPAASGLLAELMKHGAKKVRFQENGVSIELEF